MEDWTEDDWMAWVEQTYEALDAKDVDAFVAQLTPGATVRFGNGEPVAGRVAIRDALREFFGAIDTMSHAFTSQLRVDDTLVIEELVTVTRRDGTTLVLPAATVCELTEGKADRLQTYIDLSPVFAPGQAPALCRMREGAIA
ncbi:MAG TPA: nuclear transport factor 2 family protein [Gemmatimonadaceae bacterium]|nr:nuclear transport factor 2 family protein [Gemmatimonadaceae bacterium]